MSPPMNDATNPSIDPGATLGALVTANPAVAEPLDRLGLDYCCGGHRSLVDAVEAAGLDLDEVIGRLAAVDIATAPVDWATMRPAQLVDHIESTHHTYLREALSRLGALVDKVVSVHGARHPELEELQSLFGQLRADLEPHLAKEERILFPAIRELVATADEAGVIGDGVQGPISAMLGEHDRAGELMSELRSVSGDYTVPDDGCASYAVLYRGLAELEADTHLHVHKENNVLFPAALAVGR